MYFGLLSMLTSPSTVIGYSSPSSFTNISVFILSKSTTPLRPTTLEAICLFNKPDVSYKVILTFSFSNSDAVPLKSNLLLNLLQMGLVLFLTSSDTVVEFIGEATELRSLISTFVLGFSAFGLCFLLGLRRFEDFQFMKPRLKSQIS